jgi:hypothetical protein
VVSTSAGPSQSAVTTTIKLLREFLNKFKGKEAVSIAEIMVKHEAVTMNAIVVLITVTISYISDYLNTKREQ